ncbi:uncharacterized protein (DUF1330 family) [Sphingomonas faeni]|jgi:uncharacterized protein (DUF1330 family)|uniref:Uncharacterized protein (DUF1330 family) n=1 Tax=Sphingomonas faeni TaxID=185950 RepID=A0A2T5UCR9_9SPHN|nr:MULTISPECIES: DUF1330 domain-containing protein [Sphingomonas]KQM51420.1 hypothetical protein ASE69_07320 [Sphingomonas sp. Leaf208]MDD1452725.1 DUF1330 domain-containing protein [Sphingomonas sp. H160509]PTW49307.1 uncharacterized protein (DUF1330 family) [Sphingomonas faeni]
MTAYVVFVRNEVTDAEEMKQYQAKAPLAREGRTLKPLAFYGAVETLEGQAVEGAVILEFPDVAEAHAWYDSPAYQDALQHRLKGADYRVFVIEGLPG